MRKLLAFLFWALTALSPAAKAGTGYGGYAYSCSAVGVNCTGVRFTYIEPSGYAGTVGETKNTAFVWAGIDGNTHGTQCTLGSGNNNPLIQFGTAPTQFSNGTQTHVTWYEEYPCNLVTNFGSLVVNAGDSITLELLCTSNCTAGDATAVWQMTWTNNTTGLSQQRTDTNWQVYGDNVYAVIEGTSSGTDSTSFQPLAIDRMKFSNMQIHHSGSWHSIAAIAKSPWTPQHMWWDIKSGSPATKSLYTTSPPIGPLGTDFYVCGNIIAQTSTLGPPCPASAYSSSNGIGP